MRSEKGLFKTMYAPKIHINIQAKSQAGNILVKYITITQKGHSQKKTS